jgi:hypothetical protein
LPGNPEALTMTVARGFAIILASAVGSAVGGGLLGLALALATPSYYRVVFCIEDDPSFNPVQVGLGLGITQGAVAGLVIGCVVVLAVALSGLRPVAGKNPESERLWDNGSVGSS